jgi:UrcA family protein
MLRKTCAALAVVLTLALPASVSAATGGDEVLVNADTGLEMRRITISFKDLDLATAEGRRVADKRVEQAALVACAWSTGTVLPETEAYRSCYAGVIEEGRGQMIRTAQNQRKDRLAS